MSRPGILHHATAVIALLSGLACHAVDTTRELRLGRAGHAFDHLGGIGAQAETAAASGGTIIYATGIGGIGYSGLPAPAEFAQQKQAATEYCRHAKAAGIRLVIGYVCATSIVGLDSFDKNWTPAFRAQFHSIPENWRQEGADGRPLPSWYGGQYQPACMNNPDWRAYEKFIVRQQIECGHDGIFFDNPTVHPQGCYCEHCMSRFARWLEQAGVPVSDRSLASMRKVAVERKEDFAQFRCSIARDFLAEIRRYARSLNKHALITCNNSLNSPEVLFAQCRTYAYNIHELSDAEDYVVVEDMGYQPRTLADGKILEYGPTYELLRAVSRGKPVVAVTIAEADYHTPPHLIRLAMAESVAHGASYLSWPTWPEEKRQAMVAAIRPQADWLSSNEALLNDSLPRRDLALFLPFRRWIESADCVAARMAADLTRANVPFEVVSEDDFSMSWLRRARGSLPVLVVEARSVLSENERSVLNKFESAGGRVVFANANARWLTDAVQMSARSLVLKAPASVRAVVRDQPGRAIIHLLNLNIQRLSSFEDEVKAAEEIHVRCRVPFDRVRSVQASSADHDSSTGNLRSTVSKEGKASWVDVTIPKLEISSMLVIER